MSDLDASLRMHPTIDLNAQKKRVMRNIRVHTFVIVCVLAAVVGVVFVAARSSRGQTQTQVSRQNPETQVKATVKVTDRVNSVTASTSVFGAAVSRNATSRNELSWSFGGKQQRGWYLYDLLIGKTLDIPNDTVSDDLPPALAIWQKKNGLSADGVLDESSLMAFVSHWQSNRLKNRAPATPEELVTAPPSDFYDPSRAPELRQVERNTYEAYKQMMAAAAADPALKLSPGENYFKIVSAYRSREYQEELRRKSPNAGRAGLAVNSPHFTGRALDIYVGGSPVDTKDSNRAIQVNTPAYQWLVRNAERFGFRPYFYEPWHWEYVK